MANRRCWITAAIVRGWVTSTQRPSKHCPGHSLSLAHSRHSKLGASMPSLGPSHTGLRTSQPGSGAPAPTSHVRQLPSTQNRPPGQGAVCGSQATQPLSTVQMGLHPGSLYLCRRRRHYNARLRSIHARCPREHIERLGYILHSLRLARRWGRSRAVTASVIDGVTFTAKAAGTLVWALWVAFTGSTLPCLWVADWLAIWAGGWSLISQPTHSPSTQIGFTGAFAICVASTA